MSRIHTVEDAPAASRPLLQKIIQSTLLATSHGSNERIAVLHWSAIDGTLLSDGGAQCSK